MVNLGKMNRLVVVRDSPHGLYLKAGVYDEVLLPKSHVPEDVEQGDELEVFLLRDSEDRVVASIRKPKAEAGEFAELKVVAIEKVGAFLDWGLEKDLLLPFGEQRDRRKVGERVFVRVGVDPKTERLFATERLAKYLKHSSSGYQVGDEVDLQVMSKTDLGFNVIVDCKCAGLIFHNEVSRPLRRGQKLVGYIAERRGDGKLTVALQRAGAERHEDGVEEIERALAANEGFLPLTDKSAPEVIRRELGLSKKVFKRALGSLYRERKVVLEPDGIRRVE